ncbi:MAG TPA: EF-Tu/IF-2/RF-3 family GTPase, partial [Candidatus Binatia bacterium]|nr:EF-Tu/IF-2/RF-3 family GTPase [Candidatus Binatia bacterium]
FEMAIKTVPNPREAQAYRIEEVWDGQVGSHIGRALVECRDEGPTVIFVTNVHSDTNGDTVAAGRVFSGKVKKADRLHLVAALSQTQVRAVSIDMGSFQEEVTEVSAGSLVSLTLTGTVKAGETLVDMAHTDEMVPFEGINYVSEPVVTLAVEPKNPKDIPLLLDGLEGLAREDPNLKVIVDEQTGEYLLSGMGELHLEIAINQLKNAFKVDVSVSSPSVVYMESVQKKGAVALAKSPNKQNGFWVQVMPEEEVKTSAEEDPGSVLSLDEHWNVLLDCSGKTEQISEETLEAIIAGFEYACKAGPLCGESIRHLRVNLVDLQLDQNGVDASEVMHAVGKAIFGSFLTADPLLMEPIYRIIISVATELAGESSRILSSRHGKVTLFEQKGLLTVITGFIPVSETFGFSKELRSATSGRAFWQTFFDHWERLPQKQASEVIIDLRQRKGLALEVPKPERFVE